MFPALPNQAGEDPLTDGQSLTPPRGAGDCVSLKWTVPPGTTIADGVVASGGTREEKFRLLPSPRQQSGIERLDVVPTLPKEAGGGTPKVGQSTEPSLGAVGCVSQLWTVSLGTTDADGAVASGGTREEISPRQQSEIEVFDVDPALPEEAGEGPLKAGQSTEPSLGAVDCVSQMWTVSR